jgi:formate-dependent phosphoribosylglycinamide formyltransferase (GAR transformylase)
MLVEHPFVIPLVMFKWMVITVSPGNPNRCQKQHNWKRSVMHKAVTDALGGYGVFGVELFIKGEEVLFSEVSPRPHDTGMVTMISQDLSQFALHARAILGLPYSRLFVRLVHRPPV